MFHPSFGTRAWQASIAEVYDETGIAYGETAELGPGHAGLTKKAFYPADQHEGSPMANR
jgi:hypothetical protein